MPEPLTPKQWRAMFAGQRLLWVGDVILATLERYHETLRRFHDAVDALNGGEGTKNRLCFLCDAHAYDGHRGIIHRETCEVLLARALLDAAAGEE